MRFVEAVLCNIIFSIAPNFKSTMYFSYKNLKLADNRDDVILAICRGMRVLHIGAADSPFTRDKYASGLLLHKRLSEVAIELVGIDLDQEAADWMNSQGLPETRVVDMNDVSDLGFRPDVIVFGETIEHMVNVGASLNTLKSCMTSETRLVISTPNCYHLWFTSMVLRDHELIHDDHKVGFTYGLLWQALQSQGLKMDDFYFTFLPRERYAWWRRVWLIASKFKHGLSETLLAVCKLDHCDDSQPAHRT